MEKERPTTLATDGIAQKVFTAISGAFDDATRSIFFCILSPPYGAGNAAGFDVPDAERSDASLAAMGNAVPREMPCSG
ncbi:MAG: hypothetical protein QHG99_01280 [Methanomicrobiales archaeon]|nr:hypothetical protein [Methanomicrobiales archaeon]